MEKNKELFDDEFQFQMYLTFFQAYASRKLTKEDFGNWKKNYEIESDKRKEAEKLMSEMIGKTFQVGNKKFRFTGVMTMYDDYTELDIEDFYYAVEGVK